MLRRLTVLVALAPWLAPACADEPQAQPVSGTEASASGTGTTTDTSTNADIDGTADGADSGSSTGVPPEPFEWEQGDPEEHGLDPEALELLREYALAPEMNTQALLVVRHGVIVAEWYAPDRDLDSWATSWSMAKSISSLLVGIAVADGDIASLDEPMTTWVPEWAGTERESITLRHVLSMASGFAWDEAAPSYVDLLGMALRADQLDYALQQEVAVSPGEVWNYSSGTSMLLSRVVEAATGQEAVEFARARLFEPLGFERYEWWVDGEGQTLTYCCIDATSRDFARVGLLMLQDGVWQGQPLVDPEWIAVSSEPHQEGNVSYGLQWWLNREGGTPDRPGIPRSSYYAQGHDHQFIAVFPEQDMVLVRNAYFVRPEGEPVAEAGLLEAGMLLGGLAKTGTLSPDESWDDTEMLTRLMDAVVR